MKPLKLFIPIAKIDEARREIVGIAAEEAPDKSKEIFDYATSVPYFKAWSDEVAKASGGKNLGNVRAMHGKVAAGKIVDVAYDDSALNIPVRVKVTDDNEWEKCLDGTYTGLSIGGSYAKRWADAAKTDHTRYTAKPVELSLADMPMMAGATFEVLRTDGSTEMRKFLTVEGMEKAAKAPTLADLVGVVTALNEKITALEAPAPKADPEVVEDAEAMKTVMATLLKLGERVDTLAKKVDPEPTPAEGIAEVLTKAFEPIQSSLEKLSDRLESVEGAPAEIGTSLRKVHRSSEGGVSKVDVESIGNVISKLEEAGNLDEQTRVNLRKGLAQLAMTQKDDA